VLALAGTAAWVALVVWRTGRHQHALWKSLVLPAGGVALSWLLAMTLWLPVLDFARSARPVVERVAPLTGGSRCIAAQGFSQALIASYEVFGRYQVDARPDAATAGRCAVLVRVTRAAAPDALPGWTLVGAIRRPTDRGELSSVYRR
jgi:4-amino-4-deoxy-L-arabinose transferase-like glycosyltransferase